MEALYQLSYSPWAIEGYQQLRWGRTAGWVIVGVRVPMGTLAYASGHGLEVTFVNNAHLAQLARSGFGLEPSSEIGTMASGNINRSARFESAGTIYVLQELNTVVFPDPDALMENAHAVSERLDSQNLSTVRFVRNVDGGWLVDLDGVPWRCYEHVEGTTEPAILSAEDAQSTARVFGRYARAVADLELVEHLPGYHDFDARVVALDDAIEADRVGRVVSAEGAIDAALRMVDRLRLAPSYAAWREAPRRNAHNDAKAPNCVVSESGARTIIDLDTTMPGTILADVGELVRSATRALDDQRSDTLMIQIESVNRGFLAGFDDELDDSEQAAMLLAGPLMTVENAVRFLTDHLNGDEYYGSATPGHNLDRANAQLALANSLIDAIESAMAL